MKDLFRNSFLIAGLLLLVNGEDLAAQGRSNERPGRSSEAKGRNKTVPGVPIDGGIGVLLAAGAAYGLKKLNDHRQGKQP
ncbi:PID-CTERM protein-sorting domain-containing protein [Pontibacter ummariensis]